MYDWNGLMCIAKHKTFLAFLNKKRRKTLKQKCTCKNTLLSGTKVLIAYYNTKDLYKSDKRRLFYYVLSSKTFVLKNEVCGTKTVAGAISNLTVCHHTS